MVKTTVELPLDMYRDLEQWRSTSARDLGVTRVTLKEVSVALLQELLHDPTLQSTVRTRIAASRSLADAPAEQGGSSGE